jgi:hypothetical protein
MEGPKCCVYIMIMLNIRLHFLFELIEAINRSKESCFCLQCSCSYLTTYLYMRSCYIFEEIWYSDFVLKQTELKEPNILFF